MAPAEGANAVKLINRLKVKEQYRSHQPTYPFPKSNQYETSVSPFSGNLFGFWSAEERRKSYESREGQCLATAYGLLSVPKGEGR